MAVNANGSRPGNVLIGFLLGAVMVAVAIVGFFVWDNFKSMVADPRRAPRSPSRKAKTL